MSFPKFPEFRKFSITDKDEYLQYYAQLDAPYSDLSIDDAYIWLDYHHDLEVAELNGNVVLRFTNIIDQDAYYYSLIGVSDIQNTVNDLRQVTQTLSYIPKCTAELISRLEDSRIEIVEDVNSRDYVYKVDDLLALQGKPYENLRRRINHFKRSYPTTHVRQFNLEDPRDIQTIRTTIANWSQRETAARNDPEGWEFHAITTHLDLAAQLPVQAFGLYVDNQLANINIVHRPPHKEWLIFNHIKCDYNYDDIYGYAFYSLFLTAQSQGIKWVNFEQDLGILGLQQIKHLFRPARFLYRYTVSFDSDDKYQ